MGLTSYDKAIAGGVVSLVVGWLSRYGLTLTPLVHDTLASGSLAVVSYLVAHLSVYFTRNKVT